MVSLNKQQVLSTRERREAMRFKPNLQSSLAVLIALLVLLTACSPFSRNPVTASTPTAHSVLLIPAFINWLLLKAFKEFFGISRVAAIGLIEVIFIYRVFRHSLAGMQ